jgi:hypothetical protein
VVVPIDYFRYICDYNQIKMSNITKKELETLRTLNQSIASEKNQISDNFIRAIASYQRVMSAAGDLTKFNAEIEEKYGQVDIDIETGEYVVTKDSSGQ